MRPGSWLVLVSAATPDDRHEPLDHVIVGHAKPELNSAAPLALRLAMDAAFPLKESGGPSNFPRAAGKPKPPGSRASLILHRSYSSCVMPRDAHTSPGLLCAYRTLRL